VSGEGRGTRKEAGEWEKRGGGGAERGKGMKEKALEDAISRGVRREGWGGLKKRNKVVARNGWGRAGN